MTSSERILACLLVVLGFAIPAHANNPPEPDGLFSVLLIFPVVILGCRFAGLALKKKGLATRIITWLAVAFCSVVFLGAGTIIGAFAALLILSYAVVRAIQIMKRGQNAHRAVIGGLVIAFSAFAFVNYWASIVSFYSPVAAAESNAISGLRSLSSAESESAKRGLRDHASSKTPGSLSDLQAAKLIDGTFSTSQIRKGYRYGEIVDPTRGQFVFYAIPAPEMKPRYANGYLVPGTSLLKSIRGVHAEEGTGERSFAVDETGVIRWAIRTQTGPVTREEAQSWPAL